MQNFHTFLGTDCFGSTVCVWTENMWKI